MSKKTWIIGGVAVLAIAGATILGRSLNHANDSKGSTGSNKVTTLKVAHTQNYVPYDFVDEKGESDGYEVAVLKAIDEKLPDYKFEYTGTSDDDLLIGLESGKYDIGTKGAWYTEERAKKFIIPKEPSEPVSSDLPYGKKMRINTRISMTSLKKKENWFQFHHKMPNGMSSKNTMKSIRTNQSN